jgi:hypothetical protein
MDLPTSLFARFISRPRRLRVMLGLALLLFLPAFAAAYLDGTLRSFLGSGQWRGVLLPPSLILYILAVAPSIARMEANVLRSFRPLVLVDDDRFSRVLSEAARIKPSSEVVAFGIGVLLGLLWVIRGSGISVTWIELYWLLSTALMFGLLGWTIYVSLTSGRLTTALLHEPLRIDLFDVAPFNAIGRQSLLTALVFVGGITLSLLLSGLEPAILRLPEFWLVYIPLALVPVFVFFLNMHPTHQVLADAKKRELQVVQRHIQQAGRALIQRREESQDIGNLAAEIQALIAYDQRLQMTRTWPYNTAMLRTLFFSVLIPVATVLVRYIIERLFA